MYITLTVAGMQLMMGIATTVITGIKFEVKII